METPKKEFENQSFLMLEFDLTFPLPHGNPIDGKMDMMPVSQQPTPTETPLMYGIPPAAGTTVIINQPGQMNERNQRLWSSEICACCNDMESCCCTFFCPTCYLSHLYMRYNESCCVPWCLIGMGPMVLRVHHRAKHNVVGTLMNDMCTAMWCGPCMMCQLKRDMDYTEQTRGTLL